MKEGELFTAGEIAMKVKVSKQFIYNISNPKIPAPQRLPSIKIGRLRRFRYDDVLEYFKNHSYE